MSASTGNIVSRIYSGFRGVDFRGEEINAYRSPDALNVWRDYKKTSSIETRPCFEDVVFKDKDGNDFSGFSSEIYSVWHYSGQTLIHSGKSLYKAENGVISLLELPDALEMNERKSNGFAFEDKFYIMDGKNYFKYDGNTVTSVEGFIPTTSIGREPAGGGTAHQDVNMLTPYRINSFITDGTSTDYYLDAIEIDEDYVPFIEISGRETVKCTKSSRKEGWYYYEFSDSSTKYYYQVDFEKGVITFDTAGQLPRNKELNIKFKKTVMENGEDIYRKAILSCTLVQVFDNRIFLSGNEDKPNYIYHSSLNDPTYFSDLDYYKEGTDNAKITGLVPGNNALWVFREPSETNTSVFYHVPSNDYEYGKIYPSSHSSVSLGCVAKAINFNDDIIFFSERGMEGVSGDINAEQFASHRSSTIDRRLLLEASYKDMLLEEYEGYLFIIIGKHIYLADSRAKFSNGGHFEYDFFYWEIGKDITCTAVKDGVFYAGTKKQNEDGSFTYGISSLTDAESDIESYYVTPKDKFESPNKQKTTNKKGFIVEACSDEMKVFVKTDKDSDFEEVGTYTNISDSVMVKLKKKKWKDIQFKFYSDKRFSLDFVTVEAFVGGYIKR